MQVLVSNIPAQTESPLYSPEQAAVGIGLKVNANKIGFMRLKYPVVRLQF